MGRAAPANIREPYPRVKGEGKLARVPRGEPYARPEGGRPLLCWGQGRVVPLASRASSAGVVTPLLRFCWRPASRAAGSASCAVCRARYWVVAALMRWFKRGSPSCRGVPGFLLGVLGRAWLHARLAGLPACRAVGGLMLGLPGCLVLGGFMLGRPGCQGPRGFMRGAPSCRVVASCSACRAAGRWVGWRVLSASGAARRAAKS